MRKFIWKSLASVVVFSAALAPAQTAFVPTTTLSAETSNNTSASDQVGILTGGIAPSGNVSRVPMRSLMYSGSQTKAFAALMGWFGKSSHISVGYNSQDPAQVAKQVADMRSRGIDGAILAWYGKDSYENKTALALKAAAEADQPFQFAIMIDKGAIAWNSMGLSPTDALIVHLNYIADTFYASPAYARVNGRPVVYEFALESYTIDWGRVRSSIKGDPMIIFRNPNGWTRPYSDGAYAWEPDKSTLSYLDYFYQQSQNYSSQQTIGGVSPSFNDSLASWSAKRFADPQCGQLWLSKWADQNKWFSTAKPLAHIQIATWNDYEEGSTIESGIDNCLTVSADVLGETVHWALNGIGQENTIDHYSIFLTQDGQNLMKIADVPTGIDTFDLSPYKFVKGSYTVYVQAVGKPAILNKMSQPASYFATYVPNVAPVASIAVSASSLYTPATVTATTSGSYDADNNIASSVIEWGDGASSSGPNAAHVYKSAGTYNIVATVTDNYGASSTSSTSVTVQAAHVAISKPISGSTSGGSLAVEAKANNGNKVDGMWVYVDNVGVYSVKSDTVSTTLSVAPGTRTILVKAWDIYGAITQSSTQVAVANQAPVAKINVSASSVARKDVVTVNSTGSYDADGNISSTVIDFGDGFVASGASASHTYSSLGTFTISVKVTDNMGATSTATSTVTVTNIAPVAKITLSASTVFAGQAVTVGSAGSSDADGSIASTKISFGDGYTASGTSASRVYSAPGVYTVTVTVTDDSGATASASAVVTVKAPGVTITKPVNGSSTTTTSVNVAAYAESPRKIASMIVYVDNVIKHTVYASSVNTYVTAPRGTHKITVKAWEDVTGKVYESSALVLVK